MINRVFAKAMTSAYLPGAQAAPSRHVDRPCVPHDRLLMGRCLRPPIAQLAEAVDLKSIQSGFESLWGDERLHHAKAPQPFGQGAFVVVS